MISKLISAGLIAAVVIAIMVLPQSIAYAQLADSSEYGIYASVYPAISYALFNGQSRHAIGPCDRLSSDGSRS